MVGQHRCVCDDLDDGSCCLRKLDELRALTCQITVIEHINRREHRGHGIDTTLQHFIWDLNSYGRQSSLFVTIWKIKGCCRRCHSGGLQLKTNL